MDALVIIQCRYNSRRLPGKALLPLAGTTVLEFLIRRLKWGLREKGWQIVLATTRRQDDDAVARVGAAGGLEVVRGATDVVLGRFCQCLEACPGARGVVRVTADNPLTCPRSIIDAVENLLQTGADYVNCAGFPCGATRVSAGLAGSNLGRIMNDVYQKC